MCEAMVYLKDGEKIEPYFENVDKIFSQEEGLILEDIFGQKKIIKARLKELHLVDHKVIIERMK